MRNRTLSDLILALTIGLCVAAVSAERREQHAAAQPVAIAPNVADNARSLAFAVLWSDSRQPQAPKSSGATGDADERGAAERAMDRAAAAAGEAASSVEMPFFSFGSAVE